MGLFLLRVFWKRGAGVMPDAEAEAKVKLELTYIMIENDGEEIIAIDKLNGVYRVQGEDMLADVTALI